MTLPTRGVGMTEQTEGAETFRGYIDAEAAATRAFIAYKFGEVSEAEVHRLQRIAHAAQERHLAALAAAEVRGAQRIGVAVQAWAMKNEIAEPPLDWAWLGEIIRASGAPYETEEASDEA